MTRFMSWNTWSTLPKISSPRRHAASSPESQRTPPSKCTEPSLHLRRPSIQVPGHPGQHRPTPKRNTVELSATIRCPRTGAQTRFQRLAGSSYFPIPTIRRLGIAHQKTPWCDVQKLGEFRTRFGTNDENAMVVPLRAASVLPPTTW
ncbi:hypothetical protein SODALDRAFT_333812 [Sodiomyces alkalinus F11]|uniref:Uncharacterized protein n=1 Tax=Sodiomyces alkalinus (strain CBS 110278 / VKM F-3762 / F11) TaxID=1314773 RepID=A0A3N2PU74_SODAK|nr:hypothetical protein SODALDRAFT_333812 [Sodiomyces alkalinus F11]ROT38049.1 hypothetical protein SODALDRAFT_333812 [Sodiomyces alkalinus F11]